jgi:hypothetical protein
MRFLSAFFIAYLANILSAQHCDTDNTVENNCVQFTVASGTGCQWMCNYCEQTLGTTNYYFTDGVCTYETGGCVGTPQVGAKYTCCSL